MHTEKYLPNKYRDSRKRRKRNRIKHIILVLVLVIMLLGAAYFVYTGIQNKHNDKIVTPSVSSTAFTTSASPSADISSTPAVSPSPEVTPVVTASDDATATVVATATVNASPSPAVTANATSALQNKLINAAGKTVKTRFAPPEDFTRVASVTGSYAEYLRNLSLKPDGSLVKYFNGSSKPNTDYIAVIDEDIGSTDLQQCADTVLRFNAEYHYARKEYQRITYHFTNGFEFPWSKWSNGYRITVNGNRVTWSKKTASDNSQKAFSAYLQKLYTYASTLSMAKSDLTSIQPKDLSIGDVFIKGGSPGHVVQVVDMAVNTKTGKKCFILVQGYMPAQDAQILRNLTDPGISPWVMLPDNPSGVFETPEYEFTWNQLMRFKN